MVVTKPLAFAIHVTLSLLVFSSLVYVMYFWWFPGDLFFLDGGWQGLKLVALIDLVLGPLLTLVLYSPGKKNLVFDMAAIAAFQLAALGYGFYTTHQQQTFALVHSEGKFNTVSRAAHLAANRQLRELNEEPIHVATLSDDRPRVVFTEPPTGENLGQFLEDIFNGYPEPQERSDKYLPIDTTHDRLQQQASSIETLKENGTWDTVAKRVDGLNKQPEDLEFYPFRARYGSGIAIFDPETLRITDFVAVTPIRQATTETADAETTE